MKKKLFIFAFNLIIFSVVIILIGGIFWHWCLNPQLTALRVFMDMGWLVLPAIMVAYVGLWINYYIDTKN